MNRVLRSASQTGWQHALLLLVVLLLLAVAGCARQEPSEPADGPSVEPTTPPSAEPTETPSARMARGLVYFIDGEKLVAVARQVESPTIAAGSMKALLEGPSSTERAEGLTTSIPAGTGLRSVAIAERVATVDLTDDFDDGGGTLSMSLRVAQVVHTLTQFDTVDSVVFRMEGSPLTVLGGEGVLLEEPQTRTMWENAAPLILIETPAWGETVSSPMTVRGTANTFEAEMDIDLLDASGRTVVTHHTRATSGTGTRGTFETTLTWSGGTTGAGTIVGWESSAKDGSRVEHTRVGVLIR